MSFHFRCRYYRTGSVGSGSMYIHMNIEDLYHSQGRHMYIGTIS